MPSGRYVFKSTALTINEIRSESPVVWELIMLPNWTEQIWIWLLITGILVLGLWHFYHLRIQNLTLESSNARQQLTALRAQMNPHFVGNSINAIQQFFYPPDPAKASEYIYLFNALLRKTLHLSEKDFIAVSEECAYIQGYLEMIRLRYADRFYYELEMAQDIPAQAGFPSMILQPIIENATIHGLAPVGMSHLVLSFSMVQDRIVASISDNGIGIDKSLAQKKSDGAQRESKGLQILQNKVSILNQLYHIDLQIDWSDTGHGTLVLVSYQTLSNCASK